MKRFTSSLIIAASLAAFASSHADEDALEVKVPLNDKAALSLDFESPVWEKSGRTDRFQIMGKTLQVMGLDIHEEPKNATIVHLTRDDEAIYLGFECKDSDMSGFLKKDAKEGEEWPPGDRVEIYVAPVSDKENYSHFVFNAAAVRGESKDKRMVAPREGWQVKTRVEKDGWLAVVRIPYSLLGEGAKEGLSGFFFRDYHPDAKDGSKERSTWGGGGLHSPSAFGDWILVP